MITVNSLNLLDIVSDKSDIKVVVVNLAETHLFLRVYQLQLFADIHKIYANNYFHHVDSDTILICKCYNVLHAVGLVFDDIENLSTATAISFLKI